MQKVYNNEFFYWQFVIQSYVIVKILLRVQSFLMLDLNFGIAEDSNLYFSCLVIFDN